MSRHSLAAAGGMPSAVLKPLSNSISRSIKVGRQVCLLGAHRRVHLPLRSPMVSRTHALIVVDGAEPYVRDLASRNGVYINGHLVREGRLRHGDLLCVGPFAFWWICTPLPGPRPRHLNEEENRRTPMLAVMGEKAPRLMDSQTFLIGSREECNLVLRQPMVETAHAVIYRSAGAFHLRDLNSKSGTYVNGRPTRQTALRTGDEIRVGLTRMRFDDAKRDEAIDESETMTGFRGIANIDRPLVDAQRQASCPTIEQLLGAAPQRITCWEQGLIQTTA